MNEAAGESHDLDSLLVAHRAQLAGFVAKHAGHGLLRYETVDDLVQGAHAEALRSAARFAWQGEAAFIGWLQQIARRHMAGRRDHWFALKRNCAAVVRLTQGAGTFQGGAALEPIMSATGPATFAQRRDHMVIMTCALDLLLERDRELVESMAADVPIADVSSRLGISVEAATKARSRAIERLRKACEIVSQSPSRP